MKFQDIMKYPVLLVMLFVLAACAPQVTPATTSQAGETPETTGTAPAPEATEPLELTLLALNDFHGNIVPSSFRLPNVEEPIQAGGVETLATIIKEKKAENPNTVVVGAGDLIGASPLISSLLRDEVSIDALNKLGLEVSSVGNHEFDKGSAELLRIQNGGCEATDPTNVCTYQPYEGAAFTYLAANVLDKQTQQPILPPYFVKTVDGIDLAFISAVLEETPTIVTPTGVETLEFVPEADAINALVPELQAKGIETIIVLIHQGGTAQDTFETDDCATLEGPVVDITKALDPAVDVVVSGHTHRGYRCRVDGRLVTQSDAYGHLLTEIDLTIDRTTKDVITDSATSILVDPTKYTPDAEMTAIVARAKELTDPIANQPVATIGAEQILREPDASGQSPLGNLIADSQLAATSAPELGGAQIAFMNPGGIRADLPPTANAEGSVTFGDTFTVQPFGNVLTTLTLTGEQLKTLLEQQWLDQDRPRILSVSQGFSYTWDESREPGGKVLAETITLNGTPIDPAASYRVVVNSFLAEGGDKFFVLKDGTDRVGGALDLTALQDYLKGLEDAGTPATPPALDRITRLN
jgi:5'-nucleotidase